MDLKNIRSGVNPPHDVHVIIEIPLGSLPVKYEMDKDSGMLFVNRFWHTSMIYPANYGFIPQTLAKDGDPLDALVIGKVPVIPCSIMRAVPIGVLIMEDENGLDEKILTKPTQETDSIYSDIHSIEDIPEMTLNQIFHFFSHYKDLETSKWAKVQRWGDAEEAKEIIKMYLLDQ